MWTAAKSFIESAIDKEYNEEQVGLMRTGRPGRSKYKRGLNLIKVSSDCDVGSLVHEWGHHLQNANPHFLERCAEFLRYRAEKSGGEAGKVRPLHKLLPDKPYGDDEFAISDSFWDAYCGKVYSGQRGKAIPVEHGSKHGPIKTYDVVDTELLSMGLQYLYVKPIDFLLHDPEYYGFIMSLLKGEI